MSKLDKLMIQGIRSFNPSEKNVLEFHTPLTLIVGANGTGKTTIIECLKYATTGDMPPNTRGGAFIYDPKIAKEVDVKAEVRLKFRNNRNEIMFCTRTLQSSLKKNKSEQKTLECVLSKMVNDREIVITNKLSDVDSSIPEHLGVSHSILENVIFCHQDESVWPIGDPTAMKKKLDDIFSSTKYSKALLGFKASKKEISADLRLKTQQLTFFLKEKHKRDEILRNIQNYGEETEAKNKKLQEFSEEIRKVNDLIQKTAAEVKIFERLDQNYRLLKNELDNCANFVKCFGYEVIDVIDRDVCVRKVLEIENTLKSMIQSKIEDEFLIIENLRLRVLEEDRKADSYRQRIQEIQNTIQRQRNEKKELVHALMCEFNCEKALVEQKIRLEFEQAEKSIKEKTMELENLRESFLTQKTQQVCLEKTFEEKSAFVEHYKNLKSRPEIVIRDFEIDYDKQIQLEVEIDELLEDVNSKQEAVNEAFKQSEKAFKRTLLIEESTKIMSELTALHNLNQYDGRAFSDIIYQEIDRKSRCIEEFNRKLVLMKAEYERVREEEQICKFKMQQDRANNAKLFAELSAIISQIISSENRQNQKLKGVPGHQILSKVLITKKDLEELKSELDGLLEIESPKDLEKLKAEIEECRSKIESNRHAMAIYRNFLEKANKTNHCPLCRRDMEQIIKQDYDTRIEGAIKKIPEAMKSMESKLLSLEETSDTAHRYNQDIERRNEYRAKIKQILEEVKVTDYEENPAARSSMALNEIDNLKAQLDDQIRSLQNLKSRKEELEKIEKELQTIPESGDVAFLKENLSNAKTLLNDKKIEYSQYIKKIKEMENEKKLIAEELKNIEIIRKRDLLIEELKSIEIKDLSTFEINITNQEIELERIKNGFITRKTKIELKLIRIKELDSSLCKLSKEIDNASLALEKKLFEKDGSNRVRFDGVDITQDMIRDNLQYEKIRSQVLEHKNRIIKLSKDLEREKYNLKVVEENLKLKKAKERIVAIESELNNYDVSRFKKLKEKQASYEERLHKLTNTESVIRGELKQIAQSLRILGSDLEGYANSNKNYLTCAVEIKALEYCQEDLDKCINGLDKAIVDFHSTKIEEVNRTLRDLWSNTYKGNDIDYIELKSESSETRAYNYRMVMIKNGSELEMRGRSSAGQKMVASILFRIALADSFSNGCDVLALDEPTTNLDKENVESLAQTLSLIIKERPNFQLIVITHDEEFVQLLNREGVEYFYRLKRDQKGDGYIERHSIYKN